MTPSIISYLGLGVFLLELTINCILFFTLSRRWKETRIKVVALLSAAYLLFILFLAIEFYYYILNFDDPIGFYLQEGNIFVNLFPFFGGLTAGFFMLFIDYFIEEKIDSIHGFFYGAFFGAFVLNIMYQAILPEIFISRESYFKADSSLLEIQILIFAFLDFLLSTNFPTSYFVAYVIIVTIRSLRKIKCYIDDDIQRRQVSLMQLTIIFYYLNTLILIAGVYQIGNSLDPTTVVILRNIAPHMSVIMGGILMYFCYAIAPVGFLQFQRMEKLMVINRSGLLLFSYDFVLAQYESSELDVLLSGGVYALLNIFSEMVQTRNIKMINFQDKKIMLSHNENFMVALVVDKISSFLWSALESFSKMFSLRYGTSNLELAVVSKSVFYDAKNLLDIAFGRK